MGNNIDLQIACRQGELETVKLILERPTKWYECLNLDWALLAACQNGHLEVVEYLFWDNRARRSHRYDYKNRVFEGQIYLIQEAFGRACKGKHLEVAKFLIDQDAHTHLIPESICDYWPFSDTIGDFLIKNEIDRRIALEIANRRDKYDIIAYLVTKKF